VLRSYVLLVCRKFWFYEAGTLRGDRNSNGIRSFARDETFEKYWHNRPWPCGEKDYDSYTRIPDKPLAQPPPSGSTGISWAELIEKMATLQDLVEALQKEVRILREEQARPILV
jgi:hypothetical protein